MSTFRQRALDEAAAHEPSRYYAESKPVSEYFGEDVFDLDKMRRYLSPTAFEAVQAAIYSRKKIDRSVANEIATAMKTWALEKGATHYTHLFQPLTGATAEKHEAFITLRDGKAFEKFRGDALVQRQTDLRHEIVVEIEVVHHGKPHRQHLLGLEQMVEVGSGISPADRTVTVLVVWCAG